MCSVMQWGPMFFGPIAYKKDNVLLLHLKIRPFILAVFAH